MTPAQLRAFVAVVRLGSVKAAAAELGVSDTAVSMHVAGLRHDLGDALFVRSASGLAFTPGGLRLATRAAEMLGLADRTVLEVRQAGAGRRLLRLAASTLFAEHAAPGLIELFTARADDLDVELSVHSPHAFAGLLLTRSVDVALGPAPVEPDVTLTTTPFLKYQVVVVAGAEHPWAGAAPSTEQLREQTWLLGPAGASDGGAMPQLLRRIRVPEANIRIFQSDAAALDETARGHGVSLALSFDVAQDLTRGRLVRLQPALHAEAVWSAATLPGPTGPAAELVRFVGTPRALQAMLRGSGVNVGHFKPSVHVTLWS